jgi:hypothetical protein
MGPLIPNEIIPAEWNSIFALVIGIAFGYILESSGFSSSRKLAGVFYGYDFAVLKVFFTAALVSSIGILYMDYMGYLDLGALYVHPTYLKGALIGGGIMGLGFITGGFCPGTSICAAAIGKIDALVYVGGILIGIFLFSELFSRFEPLYDGGFMGYITIMDAFEISPYVFVFGFTLLAVLSFVIADIVRKRVKKVVY